MINKRKSRSGKFASVSLVLTVLAVVAVIVFNVSLSLLATRYEWIYPKLYCEHGFSVSEECRDYLRKYVIDTVDGYNAALSAEEKEKLIITFCNDRETIESEDWQKTIHDSVIQIQELFPEHIEIQYLNIWENPTVAREMGITATSNIVCSFKDKHEPMDMKDLYIYDDAYSDTPIAYNGEKMVAAALMRAVQEDSPMCYLTANHGEAFDGYEFMRTAIEAGYTLGFIDLSAEDIPDDCALLVTFDPKQDLVETSGVSSVSEVDKINEYMSRGGKYMVFLSADTFVSGGRANLEGLLEDWGIKYAHETGSDGIEKCYLIKDSANSLSVDGYTVFAQNATEGKGGEIMSGLPESNVFANSTAITVADGFESNGAGNYSATVDGKVRTVSPLMLSHQSAEAWAGGRAVARAAGDPFILAAISEQTCENGEQASLIAFASTSFALDANMKSAIKGNGRTVSGIFRYLGCDKAPVELTFKYFAGTDIETLTTLQANTITVIFAAVPAVVCFGVGAFVLIRRRYA